MKKHYSLLILLCTCFICLSFLGGVYLGRNLAGSGVLVSAFPADTAPRTESTVPTSLPESAVQPVNINTATLSELQTLPGIGPVLAQRILDYRQNNGAFSSPAELANVEGIGTKRLEAILDCITTGG